MANNINTISLEGRLVDDVRTKSFPAKNANDRGRIVVNGTIASDYGTRRDPASGEWVHNTIFKDFEFWLTEGSAHILLEGKKGQTFLLMGSIIDMSYTNKDGQKVFKDGISVQTATPTASSYSKRAEGGNAYVAQPAAQTAPQAAPQTAPQAAGQAAPQPEQYGMDSIPF